MTNKIVGIAGASGSGKSFFADRLQDAVSHQSICVLSQDYYYKERSKIPLEERRKINYDHPDAIDFYLLREHLHDLKNGRTISHPQYDFALHNRKAEWQKLEPADIILVDGILIYAVPDLLDLFDIKVFIHTPIDIAFIRRLERDIHERGRSVECIVEQYINTVRPMFLEFVEPSEHKADLVFTGQGDMLAQAEQVITKLADDA